MMLACICALPHVARGLGLRQGPGYLISSTPTSTSPALIMPPDLKEKKGTENGALRNAVVFLIGAVFDVLRTVLIIVKTPVYVHSTSKSRINSYESSLEPFY
jgi:hypothetical protein